jgi:2'-5' RNA ligase
MLALMPPAELMMEIDCERKLFSAKSGFIKALKPPVHATVYEPFHASEDIEKRFTTLRQIIKRQSPFSIELHNYNFFDHPSAKSPVIYIAVKDNTVLERLQKDVLKEVNRVRKANSALISYTPHFTIGYRDVTWDAFPEIKSEYLQKRFNASFSCDAIFLWKHNGKNWQIHDSFKFEGGADGSQAYGQLDLF